MKREKQVISPELRLEMAEQVASGKMNCAEAARAYGSHQTSVRYWTALYKEHGPAIFADIGEYSCAVKPPFRDAGYRRSRDGVPQIV